MDTSFIDRKINPASVTTALKILLIGFISSEIWFFSQEVAKVLNFYIKSENIEGEAFWVGLASFFLIILYCFVRGIWDKCKKLYVSYRGDLLLLFLVGFCVSFAVNGTGTAYYAEFIKKIDPVLLFLIPTIPILIGLSLVARALQIRHFIREKTEPFFVSDIEGKSKDGDLLNHAEPAIRFAERVFNGGASESMVFGIDAPWGVGKSTFVNYCAEAWGEKYKDRVILYRFNPLRYEDRTNLLEKFIDGLVVTLQKSAYTPELRPLVSRYSRLIKSKGAFSLFGLNVELTEGSYTVDDAFEDLENALEDYDKKVIVIVDDLDRLAFSSIKDVLFAIKKSFTLPNISYVLCYDTENILTFEKGNTDVEKIREFLEKFINVKISLFLDSETLSGYVTENFEKALQNNLQLDPYTRDKLKDVVGVLVGIFKSSDFHLYQPFLGDIRKLKRLINTLMLFEIEQTDFDNSDFDKLDLVHLIVIYINYPNIFRKIYSTETGGKRGFFSALIPYDDGYPKGRKLGDREYPYENSEYFTEYLKDLTKDQQFILKKVFDVSTRLPTDRNIDSVSEEAKKTYACFNGDGAWTGGGNLQEYLYLIVKLSKPQKRNQYNYYLNLLKQLKSGRLVKEILEEEKDFDYSNSETSHEQFWRISVNQAFEFQPKVATNLIGYLLEHTPAYSYYSNNTIGVGLRDHIDYFIVKLLDSSGWSDQNGEHVENDKEENLAEIAEWVFGEGRHLDQGVISSLSKIDRGIIGFHELLMFRLHCSADRGGSTFNVQRALVRHSYPTEKADINDVAKEMREISQKVFSIFKERYISTKTNLFEIIERITLADMAGKYLPYIEEQIRLGKVTPEAISTAVLSFKSRIMGFIIYQLGNSIISHGVGCGYYDETGDEDAHGISRIMNDYIFDTCFNPEIKLKNYEHFLDYLLISFGSAFTSRRGHEYKPSINEFTKVLDREKLLSYWKTNSEKIKSLKLNEKEKLIVRGDYTATYKEDLISVFELLDSLLEESQRDQLLPSTANE